MREGAKSFNRLLALVGVALLWALIIAGRLWQLQVLRHASYRQLAEQQQSRVVELRAPRGGIFDRGGRPLALSLPLDSVVLNPKRAPEPSVAAGILAPILDLDKRELELRIKAAAAQRRGFLWVKRKISPEEAGRLRSLPVGWIEYRKEMERFYPKGSLAPHVLGSVDYEQRGNAGIEQNLDKELRGHDGEARLLSDVRQRGISSLVDKQALPGKNVTLTIDERIQFVAEQELRKAVEANRCTTGSVVVMNPSNGEILALASYPGFDAGKPATSPGALEQRANQAVMVPFEPGSVFKVVTLAAALETTSLRPETIIPCGGGKLNLFGRVIHDHHPYGALSMADVLVHSSNIGAIQVGLRVGERQLLEYVRRFGFGRTTGVPLPGESAGMVRDLKHWGKSSIGSVAMGHEISATTVQLAQAAAVIANGGMLVRPRLVLKEQRPGEAPEVPPATPLRRVIRPETAITMRQIMEGVVLRGTGKLARLQGYTAGGKTGSAQIFDLHTKRYTHHYNSSFMGFAPLPNPALVVVVTLNGASKFGGAVAAPVFKEVATAALRLLDVPKDLPDTPPSREDDEPVDTNDLAIADLGSPAYVLPEPGTPEQPPQAAEREVGGPRVPDFRGKTLRAVLEESSAQGLPLDFVGSGIARVQFPAAGSILPRGVRVRVQFAR